MRKKLEREIRFKRTTFTFDIGSLEMNMSSCIPENGKYEPWLIKYLEIASGFYGAEKDAIDIGANIGLISIILANLQSNATVFAFEPLSIMYDSLNTNLKQNNVSNVITTKAVVSNVNNEKKIINVPVNDTVGASFVSDKKDIRESVYTEQVISTTLDFFFKEKHDHLSIKIIKIDVECWEKFVLQGATEVLKKHQPVVFVEFNVQNRSIEFEKSGKELFEEIDSLFNYIFLINRLSEQLCRITSYSDLRGAMLTGHFVEDLICFNDLDFLVHLEPYISDNVYTSYHASKITVTKKQKGFISSLSHYPDDWCHGHDFFLQVKNENSITVNLSFQNIGPYKKNRIFVTQGNFIEEIVLKKKAVSREYSFTENTLASIHVFVEKTFLAKEHINPNDPRELGVRIKIEETEKKSEYISKNQVITEASPVSKLIDSMQNQPVKVLWQETFWGESNELFAVFYSFCQIGEKFISLHGEMNIETFHKRRETDSKIANLYKCEYSLTDRGLVRTRKKHIGLGADPRMVSDGTNAYAYVIGYGEAKHPAFLYIEKDDSLHAIKARENFDWGKNWQPYLKDERLFIVHELTPYSVYEINLKTYKLEERYFVDSDLGIPAHFTNHTMFRGGANAIAQSEIVYGLGRASAQPYKHLPFLWSSENNESPKIQFVDFFNQISKKGFGIVDPTSLFKTNKNTYIGLACSETTWFHSQKFLNVLLVVDVENSYPELPTLKNLLSSYEDTVINKQPNLKDHIFHCDRMQHDIPFSYEYGVKSTGEKGTLVYGPYIAIEDDLSLTIELSYLTSQEKGLKAGSFDVCVSKLNNRGNVEFVKITETELFTTDKEIERVRLEFETRQYIGYKAEFRIMVEEGIKLNAFHIRTKEKTKSSKEITKQQPKITKKPSTISIKKKIIKKLIYLPKNILYRLGVIGGRQYEISGFKNVFLRRFWGFFGLYPNKQTYPLYYERANSFMAPKIYEFTQMFKGVTFSKSDIVLDLGCGEGSLLFIFGKYVKKAVGLDIAEHCIVDAKLKARELKKTINAEFHCAKLEEIKFPEQSFDKIVSFSVIEHIPNYMEIFEETFRILKKGGELIISVDSFSEFDPVLKEVHRKNFDVEKYFEKEELHELLKKLGFREVCVTPIFKSKFAKKWFIRVMNNPGEYFGAFKRIYAFFLYYIISWHEKKVKQKDKGIFLVARCIK